MTTWSARLFCCEVLRALWPRDLRLAGRLLDTCRVAAEHLCLSGGVSTLADLARFVAAYEEARWAALGAEMAGQSRAGGEGEESDRRLLGC